MNIVGYVFVGFIFLMLNHMVENITEEEMHDNGYIKKSRYDKAMKYASSNIVSIEKSNKDKLISFFKTLIYFIPIVNVLKLILSLIKYPLIDLYIYYLKKHDKLLDANSEEASFTYNIEKQIESLQNEKANSFLNKITEFIDQICSQDDEEIEDNNDEEITLEDNKLDEQEEKIKFKSNEEKEFERKEINQIIENMRKDKKRERRELDQVLENIRKEKEYERRKIEIIMEEFCKKKEQERIELEQSLEIIRKRQKHLSSSQENAPKKLRLINDSSMSQDNENK